MTDKKIITLFNKCDRLKGGEIYQDFRADRTLRIAAKTGAGLEKLKETLEEILREGKVLFRHTFPLWKGGGDPAYP